VLLRSGGGALVEAVKGSTVGISVNATTLSDFLSVKSLTFSSAPNVPIKIGTSSMAGTPWKLANWHITPPSFAAYVTLNSSSATATWEFTLDDPMQTYPSISQVPNVFTSTNVAGSLGIVGAVGSSGTISSATITMGNINFPVAAWRMTLGSTSVAYAMSGSVIQSGIG
jgi:hypothetical protein